MKDKDMNIELIKSSREIGIMRTTITEVRLRKKGYIPFLEYYHQI